MDTIKLKQRGVLTLPKKIREKLGLHEGQIFRIETRDNQILLEPELSAHDRQLLADVRESLEDLKHGRFIEFESVAELHERIVPYEDSAHR